MDDVRLAWQIRFEFGALMVLAHRLVWPTADLGRAALQCQCPQFGHGVLHLGGAGVHGGSTLASHLSWRTSHLPLVLVSLLDSHHVCISTPALPVTASTVSRRVHLRGQSACIPPPLQQLLIAARLGCQPRRLHRARRVSISTRRASVADSSNHHQLLLHPLTQTRGHEPRLPAPARDGAPRRAQPAPERAAGQHQDRVRNRVAAQRRLRGPE